MQLIESVLNIIIIIVRQRPLDHVTALADRSDCREII